MTPCIETGLDERICPCGALHYRGRESPERDGPFSSSPRVAPMGNPGASTLPELAGQLARGDSFCPLEAVTPRFFITSHPAANTH